MQNVTEFPDAEIQLRADIQKVVEIPKRQPWEEKLELVRQLCAPGSTDTEFELYCYQAKRTGLDPLAKQIYCIRRWNSKTEQMQMAIQTAIDGFRVTADRTGKYAGQDKPEFEYDDDGILVKVFVRVYKMVEGIRCPFEAEAYWEEYCPKVEREAFFWRKMPHGQLAKCAEALALRKAFPAELSGVYIHEEMDQAGPIINGANGEGKQLPEGQTACKVCGNAITDYQYGKVKRQSYTAAQLITLTTKLHNRPLCGNCWSKMTEARIENEQQKFDAAKAKREAKKHPQNTITPEDELAAQWENLANAH